MRTIDISRADMEPRIARFDKLEPLEAQKNTGIPVEAADIVWSRKLLSVIGLDEGLDTPINASAPIRGAGGITIDRNHFLFLCERKPETNRRRQPHGTKHIKITGLIIEQMELLAWQANITDHQLVRYNRHKCF